MCFHDVADWCEPVPQTRIEERMVGWWWLLDATRRQQSAIHRRSVPEFVEPGGHSRKMSINAPWAEIREWLHGDTMRGSYSLIARVEVTPGSYSTARETTSIRVVLSDRVASLAFRMMFGEHEA